MKNQVARKQRLSVQFRKTWARSFPVVGIRFYAPGPATQGEPARLILQRMGFSSPDQVRKALAK